VVNGLSNLYGQPLQHGERRSAVTRAERFLDMPSERKKAVSANMPYLSTGGCKSHTYISCAATADSRACAYLKEKKKKGKEEENISRYASNLMGHMLPVRHRMRSKDTARAVVYSCIHYLLKVLSLMKTGVTRKGETAARQQARFSNGRLVRWVSAKRRVALNRLRSTRRKENTPEKRRALAFALPNPE